MVVAVIVPTVALTPPMVTVAPLINPVPVIVIEVPPAVVPEVGLTEVMVGAGDVTRSDEALKITLKTPFSLVITLDRRYLEIGRAHV